MELKLRYFIFATIIAFVFSEQLQDVESEPGNSLEEKNSTTPNTDFESSTSSSGTDIKKLTKKRCAREYNVNCLKVDFISSIEKLGKSTDFQILPGIRVISNADTFALQKADDSKMVFSANNVGEQLDDILVRRLVSYARSLSLNVQLFDKDQRKGKSFGFNLIPNLFTSVEGRADKKPGKWSGTLITAGVLTGCALLWMGLSSIMAMATKALAASLLSIIITIVTAYRSSGHSHKSTTYEIVAKPVYSHPYAAELQHDPHATATGHQYGRNMEWDKMASMSSRSEIQNICTIPRKNVTIDEDY